MTTKIMHPCIANPGPEGDHGLQTIQSILLTENLYYFECGCIYSFDSKTEKMTLLKANTQFCSLCERDVDGLKVMRNNTGTWCLDCADGIPGMLETYDHSKEPKIFTGYVKRCREINDEIKRNRDKENGNNFC